MDRKKTPKTSNLLLPALILTAFATLSYLTYQKYLRTAVPKDYSVEDVLRFTKLEKNKPVIEELFKLGDQVRDVRDLKSSQILDDEKRKAHILLNRMCRDTCKTIRCRIDPGLGHACRINCPDRRVKICKIATKEMP